MPENAISRILLLRTCAEHELFITNTVFCFSHRNRTNWMQTRSRHWQLIYFVITRRKDSQDVRVPRQCVAQTAGHTKSCLYPNAPSKFDPNDVPKGRSQRRGLSSTNFNMNFNLAASDIETNWCAVRDVLYSSWPFSTQTSGFV